MGRAFLCLGSNIAPARYLPLAIEQISTYGKIVTISGVWQSAPADGSDQADFCNLAVLLETELTPARIWDELIPAVESACGRERDPSNPYAARTCDVDLALYDDVELTHDRHRIPDPDLLARAFLAVPLAQLEADYVVPGDGRTLRAIADALAGKPALTRRADIDLLNTASDD